jgi:DNA-binding response OmpR family regulator
MSVVLRILVADDNMDEASSLAELFRFRGHAVREVYEGLGAFKLAEEFRPHAMVLDIAMPGMCGYEVSSHVRAHAWGRDTLIVALSGWGDFEDKVRSQRCGFDYHVTKPIEFTQVIKLVERSDTCLTQTARLLRPPLLYA